MKRRVVGTALFALGLFLFVVSHGSFTGAVVGYGIGVGVASLVGLVLMVVGGAVFTTDERKGVEGLVEELHHRIAEKRAAHRGNPKYVRGLVEIEKRIDEDARRYEVVERASVRKVVGKRLEEWVRAVGRRDEYFFGLPHHVEGVVDLPDGGLYEYQPLGGRGTRIVELDVVHYTDARACGAIRKAFEGGRRQVFFRDGAGWAYFVAEPLPEELRLKDVRCVLGTGLQDYVPFPKQKVRTPENVIKLRLRVPRERVLVREVEYEVAPGAVVKVRKFAIAGGITSEDVVRGVMPESWRYAYQGRKWSDVRRVRWGSAAR